MDIENRRVNTFEAGRQEKRYFGRDITNTEHNLFAARDPAKSRPEFKSIDVDKKRQAGPKPSPTHPHRHPADPPKKLHRRQPTNDLDRSAALDRRDPASRSKGRPDPPEPADPQQKQDLIKQNLSKLLKVKQRQGLSGGEGSQDRLGPTREHLRSRERPLDGRKPSTVREFSNQARFGSLVAVAPCTKASSAACRQPAALLPGQPARPGEKDRPSKKLLNNKFQHLRLQLEEQRREEELQRGEEREGAWGAPAEAPSFENELDAAGAGRLQMRQRLRRQFDLAFTWEFLLARDVRSAD